MWYHLTLGFYCPHRRNFVLRPFGDGARVVCNLRKSRREKEQSFKGESIQNFFKLQELFEVSAISSPTDTDFLLQRSIGLWSGLPLTTSSKRFYSRLSIRQLKPKK